MSDDLLGITLLSLRVALVATVAVLPFALAIGYALARSQFRGKAVVQTLIALPMVVPPVAVGLFLLLLVGGNGPLGGLLDTLGIRLVFTWWAAALAAAVVGFPLLVRACEQSFAALDRSYVEMAYSLGESRLSAFFRVSLPMARRGVLYGTLLCFTRGLGEFGATALVAGIIPGRTETLSLAIWSRVQLGDEAAALALCARHPAGNRVDAKIHLGTVLLQQFSQLLNYMLGLGHCHAITGNNRDIAGGFQDVVGILGIDRLDLALDHSGLGFTAAETTEQHIGQGTVHRLAHYLGEDNTGGTYQRTCHDQDIVVHRETRRTGRQARVGVQQGNHHRHVGTADRNHHHHAEHQCQCHHQVEPHMVSRLQAEHDRAGQDAQNNQAVNHLLAAEQHRAATDALTELAVGDQAACEGHTTDQDGQYDRDQGKRGGPRCERGPTHQQTGHTTKAIEQGYHLGHCCHLHQAGSGCAYDRADRSTDGDPLVFDDALVQQGRNYGQQHTHRGNEVTATGCSR